MLKRTNPVIPILAECAPETVFAGVGAAAGGGHGDTPAHGKRRGRTVVRTKAPNRMRYIDLFEQITPVRICLGQIKGFVGQVVEIARPLSLIHEPYLTALFTQAIRTEQCGSKSRP